MPDEQTGQEDFVNSLKRPDPNAIPEDVSAPYRILFNSEVGRMVLAHMMCELGLLNVLETQEDMYRHNCAVNILANIGVITSDSMPDLIHAIMNTLPERVKKENSDG